MTNEWNTLLGQLGQRLGIEGLQADDQGYCALSMDDGWVLHLALVPARQGVQCMAELGSIPVHDRETILARMLHANALLAGTDGAALGLDAARNQGVLTLEAALAALDAATLEAMLERFVLQTERWRGWLSSLAHGQGVAATASTAPGDGLAHHWVRG